MQIKYAFKFVLAKLTMAAIVFTGTSCGNDISDCPSKLCTLAGGWRLVEVRVNGVKDTSTDITKYRLTLYMPNPTTALTSDFDRTNPSGRQDNGEWELVNNNTVLALHPAQSPQENYVIDRLTPRQMILITDLEEDKTGRDEYEFVLEPF
ncbi:MAG TPA: lipocalin family protein [Chryseolinea sp.]|nr:lipocalin family protein [Chryseolinea sp.]